MAPDALKLVGSLARRGLELRVCAKGSSALTDLLPLLRRARRDGALPGHAAALIYVPTVSEAEAIGAALRGAELRVGVYHAASPDRASTHQRFVRDELDVVVATIAFGMGVDKPDVRLVVHSGPAATPAPEPPTGPLGLADRLEKLAALHERGALTDAEFAKAKANLLGL